MNCAILVEYEVHSSSCTDWSLWPCHASDLTAHSTSCLIHWPLWDFMSTLVQVMAWCRQATSHYLRQCSHKSLSPYGITRPQWVNSLNNKTMYIINGIYCTQPILLWAGPPSKTSMLSLASIMDHYLMWMGRLNETPACKTLSQGAYIPATANMGIMLVPWCKLAIPELNIWYQFIIQQ